MMDCSIIIASFNRAHLLRNTLDSLTAQELPAGLRWEVIVVDNNSNDGTRGVIEECARQRKLPIRYFFEGRQGKSFALNKALAAARGDISLFTDDDITPQRDWLTATLAAMTKRGLDGVGGKVLPRWEVEPPPWFCKLPHLMGWLAILDSDEPCLLEYPMTEQRRLVGANMALRRALFKEFGNFNTDLGHRGKRLYGSEETELIERFLRGGKVIGYEPASVVYHHIGQARLTKRFFIRRVFYQAIADTVRTKARTPFVWRTERWRYRALSGLFVRTLAHTALRRGDAFECQLEFSRQFGSLWARTMRSRNYISDVSVSAGKIHARPP